MPETWPETLRIQILVAHGLALALDDKLNEIMDDALFYEELRDEDTAPLVEIGKKVYEVTQALWKMAHP